MISGEILIFTRILSLQRAYFVHKMNYSLPKLSGKAPISLLLINNINLRVHTKIVRYPIS